MARAMPDRLVPRHHLRLHRQRLRPRAVDRSDVKTSDLVLAILGVTLLGGLCLLLAGSLIGHALAP